MNNFIAVSILSVALVAPNLLFAAPCDDAISKATDADVHNQKGKRALIFGAVELCLNLLTSEEKTLFTGLAKRCGDLGTADGVIVRDAIATCNLKAIDYVRSLGSTRI